MSKPFRKCIFCGASANSKEHIWPTWLHDLLGPVPERARHNKEVHNYNPKVGLRVTGPTGRQGDQRTVRVRAVCTDCNNGWMNRLEGKVRPYLTPLATGERITLDQTALGIVAKWLSLKVMVVEHDAPDTVLAPQADRTAFMNTLEPPSYFRLYVAHNLGVDPLFFLRHSLFIAYNQKQLDPLLDGTDKNVQVVTMVAGKVVLQAVCTRIASFTIEDKAMVLGFHNSSRFWPDPPATKEFPARPRLDKAGIHQVATFMERYVSASDPIWKDWPI